MQTRVGELRRSGLALVSISILEMAKRLVARTVILLSVKERTDSIRCQQFLHSWSAIPGLPSGSSIVELHG